MEEITSYRAYDGKMFECEQDCIDYENSMRLRGPLKNCRAFNKKFEPLEMNFVNDDRWINEAFYIYAPGDNAKEAINEVFHDYYGYTKPFEASSFFFSEGHDFSMWVEGTDTYLDMVEEFRKMQIKLTNFIDIIAEEKNH